MFHSKGTTKHCCYGTCRSDSRYGYLPHMDGVKWHRFPKPHRELEKCKRWVHLCGRRGFTTDSVKKHTFICSKHFPNGNFAEDPFLATSNVVKKARKVPAKRQNTYPDTVANSCKKRKKNIVDNTSCSSTTLENSESNPTQEIIISSAERKIAEIMIEMSVSNPEVEDNGECFLQSSSINPAANLPGPNSNMIEMSLSNTEVGDNGECFLQGSSIKPAAYLPGPNSNMVEMSLSNTAVGDTGECFLHSSSIKPAANLPGPNESSNVIILIEMDNTTHSKLFNAKVNTDKASVETTTKAKDRTKELIKLKIENKILRKQISLLESSLKPAPVLKNILRYSTDITNQNMIFYTGLTHVSFRILLDFLGDNVNKLHYWHHKNKSLSGHSSGAPRKLLPADELMCTLMRMRLGLLNQDLACRFNISNSTVISIVFTWVQFLFKTFKSLEPLMLPSKETIAKNLPACFKPHKNIRIILDATEFLCQTPKHFERQGNLFSQYKNHTTMKVLIGIIPTGGISFVSPVYEGSISDRELFIKSGLIDKLLPGDVVLADRGFIIKDILQKVRVELNIPPFLKGRKKFSANEDIETRQIAKARIHVERAIERLKKFKILAKTIPLSMSPIINQMVFVIACLVNFQQDIVT